jgi:hypothetical protein
MDGMRRVSDILKRLRSKRWDPEAQQPVTDTYEDVAALAAGFALGKQHGEDAVTSATMAVAALAEHHNLNSVEMVQAERADKQENDQIKEEISVMTNGNAPLAWNDIIGGEDAGQLEDQMVQDIAADLGEEAAPQKQKHVAANIAADDPMYAVQQNTSSAPPPSTPPAPPAPPQAAPQEEAQNVKPLTWMDVIGGDAETIPSTPPPVPPTAESRLLKTTPPPPQALPEQAPEEAAAEIPPEAEGLPVLSWADIIGHSASDTVQTPPPAQEPATALPPAAAPEPEAAEEKTLSWADIIGTDDDANAGDDSSRVFSDKAG